MSTIRRSLILLGLTMTVFICSCTCTGLQCNDIEENNIRNNAVVSLEPSEPEEPEESEPEILYEEPADGMVNGVNILTYEEALSVAKEAIIDRETSFSVDTEVPDKDINTILEDIYNAIIAPTGVPTEGDYIYMSIRDISLSELKTLYSGARPYVHYDFSVQYYSTKDQETAVGQRINEILLELGVYNMNTDIEKVSAIYQWITANVVYDELHTGDTEYLSQYSAYGALFDYTAVCQGICSLMYRMLLTAGVDCRCIVGEAAGDNHAWNIIDIDGIWYNADATWDLGRAPENYEYFLKGADSFNETHFRNGMFATEEFYNAYPTSLTDYGY